MTEKRPCPNCATPVSAQEGECPHCGQTLEAPPPPPPAPPPGPPAASAVDLEHLRLIGIFHYVVGALIGCFSCFPLIHVAIGTLILVAPDSLDANGHGPPRLFGLVFMILGGAFVLIGWTIAGCMLFAGRALARRRHLTFCLFVAGASCFFMPLGTILGVFTFIVLLRPSVKALFDQASASR